MATKYQLITELYESTIKSVTNPAVWTAFLRSACRNYKCRFDEQILIYAQRPDATAVLEIEKWNKQFGLWVNRGAKGIAVFDDEHNGNYRLKHYFDISDTHKSRLWRTVPIWQMKPEYETDVIETLENTFGELSRKDTLTDAILSAADNAVEDNIDDYLYQLNLSRDDSMLEDLDELNVEVIYKDTLKTSIAYMLLSRCDIDPAKVFDRDDFRGLFNFNTPSTVNALGIATTDIAEMGLREIASTVLNLQNQEKNQNRTFAWQENTAHNVPNIINSERGIENGTDIQRSKRVSDTRPDSAGGTGGAWQIRVKTPGVPERTQEDTVYQPLDVGQAGRTPDGDRADGASAFRPDSIADGGGQGRDGGTESLGSDEVGRHDEQYPAQRGGNDLSRPDLQLSKFPAPDEQQKSIEEAEETARAENTSAFSISGDIPQEVIDEQLIRNSSDSSIFQPRFRIYHHFHEFHTEDENIKFLKEDFGTGGGRSWADHEYWVESSGKGLTFTKGNMLNPDMTLTLSWKKAVVRISELIAADRYLTPQDKELYPQYLEYLENQTILREKERFIDSMAALPPSEKRDTLPLRLADYLNGLEHYEKEYLGKHELTEIADATNAGQIDALLINPQKTQQLFDALSAIKGATTSAFTRNHAWRFGQELEAIHPRKYEYHLGDTVFIGSHEYEMLAYDENTVRLYDTLFPLINVEMPRAEFDEKIAENPLNAHLIVIVQQEATEPHTPVIGECYEIQGRLFEVDNISGNSVSLRDVTFQNGAGFPIFRRESIEFIQMYSPVPAVSSERVTVDSYNATDDVIDEDASQMSTNLSQLPTANYQLLTDQTDLTPSWEKKKRPARVSYFDAFPDIPMSERRNFKITDDNLGHGGDKAKCRANIEAIKLLHGLEYDRRIATPEEQEILSHYVGWGSLPQVFEENREDWKAEFMELNTLLSPEEYASARATTLNAHYTSPTVIKAIYKTIARMGFTTGNILDPGCGIGNFQGLLPDSMSGSKVYGIEIDPITGRIAQQLYQRNSIAIQGYEDTALPDSFFDLAIGNIPFGNYGVADKRYDKHKFNIHDYFIAKTLDKVRPGGIIAFITSKGTMDKQNSAVRRYIAQRADLLGAIRLPNNTFLANAGTEVTTDIIFLQKRDKAVDFEPEWIHLGQTEDGVPVNSYFAEHPDMVLGEMAFDMSMFGNEKETSCHPYPDGVLAEQLDEAITNINGEITEYERGEDEPEEDNSVPADPTVRNFSFTLYDGQIYYRENSRMFQREMSATAQSRVRGMIGIRDCVRTLIEYQAADYPESDIRAEQAQLNTLYDSYTRKYGLLSDRANSLAFDDDSGYPLLCSLEILDENRNLKSKADMFTKRTIRPTITVTHADTAAEALAISISETARVDIPFMTELTGKEEAELVKELEGVIFLDYRFNGDLNDYVYRTADDFLSGNVREKLKKYSEALEVVPDDYVHREAFSRNVRALEAVQPEDLTAPEISVRLGATWLPPDVIKQFISYLLNPSWRARNSVEVIYSPVTAEWNVTNKSIDNGNITVFNTYGTKRVNAYWIIENTLNLRDVRVYDTQYDQNGKETRVLNKDETDIAQDRQDTIKQKFMEWVWDNPTRRERLCKIYNEQFNSTRPREYDGSHIKFVGMNPEYELDTHQVNAVARHLYGGNALFGHTVGAGKTFSMIASAMEGKRLGLCNKAMFVVPNNIIGDFAGDFFRLYPSANVLMTTAKDFEKKNRKKFTARIATGDYDGIIIGHSQFEKLAMSIERQVWMIEKQIREIEAGIKAVKEQRGERFTIKQMEKSRKALEVKLKRLNDQSRKDDLMTFEELGIDRLFVDEADLFKNLYFITKIRNVAGIAQTDAQKAADLFMKTQYLDEITDRRGVVFATGTPVSNTMAEVYTMQRYLQYDTLVKNNLQIFDSWASTFGETVTSMEITPDGTGIQPKTRFSNFYNLPELMAIFHEVADIKTKDMLDLRTPKVNFHTIVSKPSDMQKEMIIGLSERADMIRKRKVDASTDNMLLITNDGRKLALDQRLLNPMLPDFEGSKVNSCVGNVFDIWERTKPDRLTQIIFCDLSTPKGDGTFSVYEDIRAKLVAKGIPADEIAFVHEAKNEMQKKEMFAKVRTGTIRVILGSTSKLGAGTNIQDKLIAIHDVDCPWRPRDLEQRCGRIERQGNNNAEVDVYRYVTEGTFDSYLYQMIENKQRYISQVFTSKSPARVMQEIDDVALSYAEIKALATGNPYIIEHCTLTADIGKLRTLKASHLSQRYELEDKIHKHYPAEIARLEERITGYKTDVEKVGGLTQSEGYPMLIDGAFFKEKSSQIFSPEEKRAAGTAIIEACKSMTSPDPLKLGLYRGFEMELSYEPFSKEYRITLKGALSHIVSLGTDVFGNITRLDNALEGMGAKLKGCEEQLTAVREQMATAQEQVKVPFPREKELADKTVRLAELTVSLRMNEKDHEILDSVPDEGDIGPPQRERERER